MLASVTLSVVGVLLGAAYFVGFWGLRGATPGKELLGLRVTDEDGGSPIGLGRAALRFLGYLLSAASLGIGFLMIAAGGGGLHDRVARTREGVEERVALRVDLLTAARLKGVANDPPVRRHDLAVPTYTFVGVHPDN